MAKEMTLRSLEKTSKGEKKKRSQITDKHLSDIFMFDYDEINRFKWIATLIEDGDVASLQIVQWPLDVENVTAIVIDLGTQTIKGFGALDKIVDGSEISAFLAELGQQFNLVLESAGTRRKNIVKCALGQKIEGN